MALHESHEADGNYRDLPDGKEFPEITENTVYLIMNTDGLSPVLSKRFQVWPIVFSIVNLPPSERRKFQNLLLGGEFILMSYRNMGILCPLYGQDTNSFYAKKIICVML